MKVTGFSGLKVTYFIFVWTLAKFWLILGNNDYLVELLLQHPGLNVNLRGLDGYTALIRACQERADYVAMILSHPEVDINLVFFHFQFIFSRCLY